MLGMHSYYLSKPGLRRWFEGQTEGCSVKSKIFQRQGRLESQTLGEGWFSRAIESGIEPLVAFAKRLKSYLPGILAYCRRPLHTSLLEGINNKIKVIKRLASGTTTTSSSKSEPLSPEFGDEP